MCNHLIIDLGSNQHKILVTIMHINGKLIYSASASATKKVEVNTEDFNKGAYVVQIQAANFIGTKKLVVEK
ncbi:MAG: T9SS type A sorting domain-containing protein [Saprospiraceae bacterium]|jgi:hypothetical protein|nr:T9SS type A sorting domain-containing protein [Candidatus Vicinibacter proximus]